MDVYLCRSCYLSQLGVVVSQKIIFDDYLYLSSSSIALKRHYAKRRGNRNRQIAPCGIQKKGSDFKASTKFIAAWLEEGKRIYGVGAPSRASTLVNYAGLDDGILDCIVEIKGSHKIGKYMPGTLIPVVDESELFDKQPEYALLLSWHIAYELMTNLREKGYKGKFIVPLPVPEIIA